MTIVNTGTVSATTTGTLTDPSTAAGQFVLVAFGDDDALTNPIAATGFTQELNQYEAGDGGNAALLYEVSSGGVGATIAPTATQGRCTIAVSYSGVDSTTPFDVTPTSTIAATGGTGTSWTVTAPSITTVTDGCRILTVIMADLGSPWPLMSGPASAAGWTELAHVADNDPAEAGEHATSIMVLENNTTQAVHGATGTTAFTVPFASANSGGWVVYTIALRPGASVVATIGKSIPKLLTPAGKFNRLLPPFWPPGRESQLTTKAPAVAQPSVSVAPLALTLAFAGVAGSAFARFGLALPSPTLPGEFNRLLPPFWPPGRESQLTTKAPAVAQPSVSVATLALLLAGQSIKGRNAALTSAAAFTLGLSSVKGRNAALLAPEALTLGLGGVKGRVAAILASKALTLGLSSIKGRPAALVSAEALTLGLGGVKGRSAAVLAPEALTLGSAAVKGQKGAIVSPEALTLGGGATKARVSCVVSRLPLVLNFAAVGGGASGSGKVSVSPMVLSFAGPAIKAQLRALLVRESLTLAGQTVHGATAAKFGTQALTLGGGATKARLGAIVARLPLTLSFSAVGGSAGGGGGGGGSAGSVNVTPMLVTFSGGSVSAQRLAHVAPLMLTETWATVRLPGDVVVAVTQPGRTIKGFRRKRRIP